MKTNVIGVDFKLTQAIVQHAELRMNSALNIAESQVCHAVAFLGDINGDHGGPDKSCRIVVYLHKVGAVITRAVDRDLYAAIDRAAVRLRHALSKKLGRARKRNRGFPRRLRKAAEIVHSWPQRARLGFS
jgi:ribosome-associated translation inhibitor RaiA